MVKSTGLGKLMLASFLLLGQQVSGFAGVTSSSRPALMTQRRQTTSLLMAGANPGKHVTIEDNKLLEDFKTSTGEILNPYAVLNVDRDADRIEIRKSFAVLSKRYHPDARRHKDILPGSW
uniref:J domain-containing protein n=1 Tax=Grammatophora oceanica TaxID=210454 RepID=A0A7S1Y2H3_9STRA|mmetsp:Transcript_12699/g.18709  ORF Transcript_12699/g.18709 Transcript_12699/m.18709 type:complete len:120 (+) Transcript_12699:116-475(+)